MFVEHLVFQSVEGEYKSSEIPSLAHELCYSFCSVTSVNVG